MEKTINFGGKEIEADVYIDDIPFYTTSEGKKLLDQFLVEHNELNHIKKELQKE